MLVNNKPSGAAKLRRKDFIMECTTIYEDGKTKIVHCTINGEMAWTSTYILDEAGCIKKHITVFPSGIVTVEE